MDDAYVQVCQDGASCEQCRSWSSDPWDAEWVTFFCDHRPITGNQIKVLRDNGVLAFCEVNIFYGLVTS